MSVKHVDGLLARFKIYSVQREPFPIFSCTSGLLVPPGLQQAEQIFELSSEFSQSFKVEKNVLCFINVPATTPK